MYKDDKVLQTFLRKAFMYFTLFLVLVSAMIGGCSLINEVLQLKNDNIIEEAIEQIIENETGVEIDLTPETEEKL